MFVAVQQLRCMRQIKSQMPLSPSLGGGRALALLLGLGELAVSSSA